jgi:hypothetical protein
MAADLESSYREVEEKSKAYATYKQVTDDIKSLKKSAGNNLTQADRLVNKGLPDGLSNVTKKYEQEVKNQFDRLLDFAKFNPNGRGAQGNSTTLNYIKKALIASANRSSPKIMKLLQDEMINALGCSEQEEYQQGIQVTVPLWSIDLFKQLKQEPNSVTGKLFYEKSDSTSIGTSPFSLNRSFYYATQNTNPNYFNQNFGSSYLGYSNQSLFDITFNPTATLPPPFNYQTESFIVTLGNRPNPKVSEFFADYFRKIKVIESKNILAQIIEILTGAISIKLMSDMEEQSKFLLRLQRILGLCFDFNREIDVSGIAKTPEVDAIDQSFFELTEIDLRTIDARISDIQLGVVEFTDCDNVKFPVDIDSLFDLINQMNFVSDPNAEDNITDSLTQTLLQSQGWGGITLPTGLEVSINTDILKSLPRAVVLALLTPKILFPFVVMSLALGKTFVYEFTNLTEFIKKNIKLMVNLTSKIFAIFVKELFDIIVKDLRILVQAIIGDLARNAITKRYAMILSLIELALVVANLVSDYRRCKSVVDEILQILSLATRSTPFYIPTPLLAAAPLRPGFDNSRAFTNVITEYQRLGLPTGPMPDGSPNLMLASKFAEITGVQNEDIQNGVVNVLLPAPAPIKLYGIKA